MSAIRKEWQSDDGSVRLILGDCLEVLPTLATDSVSCVVTSPPYNTLPTSSKGSGLHGERASGVNKWLDKAANGYSDTMPEADYQEWLCCVVGECLRVSSGLVWVNHKVRYRDGVALHPVRFLPFPIYSEVIWDRHGSMALNCKRYAPSHEVLLGFGRPRVWNDEHNTLMTVWRITPESNLCDHPCPFPTAIAARPIMSSTQEGDTVLEPFLGSGTTAVACVQKRRKCIGIEKEPRFFDMAVSRVSDELKRTALLEPPVKMQQRSLLDEENAA